jgi:magnesium transporter
MGQVIAANGFFWLDLVDPKPEQLIEVARKYGLHPASVQDCLDPKHLPKHERIGDIGFTILRAYDEAAGEDADTAQELTRKLAIFVAPSFVITVHRKDQPFLRLLKEKWGCAEGRELGPETGKRILRELFRDTLQTFDRPVERELEELDLFEKGIFGVEGARTVSVEEGYYLKRRAAVIRRIAQLSLDALGRMGDSFESPTDVQDLRDRLASLTFNTDSVQESMSHLLNLHLSVSSHRTNEVMRILTVFSLFFMPLNLIASIYGMNFEHMPELKSPHGYPLVLGAMATTGLGILLWFRRKGWLR